MNAGRTVIHVVWAAGITIAAASTWFVLSHRSIPDNSAGQAASANDTEDTKAWFQEVSLKSRLTFFSNPGHPCFFYPEILGGGCGFIDYDLDGRLDVVLRTAAPGSRHPISSNLDRTSRLYQQQNDGSFLDVTELVGLDDSGTAMGIAQGDVNNDGWPDLYFSNYRGGVLFINDKGRVFHRANHSGIRCDGWGASCCFSDFDRDGRLDLFVTSYCCEPLRMDCQTAIGRRDYCHPRVFQGSPSQLYRNVTPANSGWKGVRFEDVSMSSGIALVKGRGLGVIPTDLNNDGWPDFYVANDAEPNVAWINQKNGTFKQEADAMCLATDASGRPQGSMGIAEGDVNGDGKLDIAVSHFRGEYTALYVKDNHGYRECAARWRLPPLSREVTGFGLALVDFNGDGNLEIVQANGKVAQREDSEVVVPPKPADGDSSATDRFWKAYSEHSMLITFRGNTAARLDRELSPSHELDGIGRGLAIGDINGDGRPDVVINRLAGRVLLFQNTTNDGNILAIRAIDPTKGNRDALGALVTVRTANKTMVGRLTTGGSYLSAHSAEVYFGIGSEDHYEEITVQWPDGSLQPEKFAGGSSKALRIVSRGQGSQ